jgi:hypothetical protein
MHGYLRPVIYALMATLLVAEAVWNFSSKRISDDDVEISAARRMPHTATIEDAIY